MLSRAGQPANRNTAGTPASSPAMAASMQLPTLSPVRFEAGESTPPCSVRCASGQRQHRPSSVTAIS
eukprot:7530119-Pyramimonas_sp.AAC.1